MSARPPALGRWLLRVCLPEGVISETIAGDLEQEYRDRPRRLRYLRQVSGILLFSARDRVRGYSWFVARRDAHGDTAGGKAPRPPRRAETLLQDLRFAIRMLGQRPLFTAVAVGTLALGMGINTSMFSIVNALLLRPIPAIQDPETIIEIARGEGEDFEDVAWGAFQLIRNDSTTVDDVAGWDGIALSLRDEGAVESTVFVGREVTGNYFSVLGMEPSHGRFFAEDSFWPDVASEVVISHHLWQERYGGDRDVLGRQVFINGAAASIIGVTPEGFAGHQVLTQRDVYVPIGMNAPGMLGPPELGSVRGGYMVLIGRLAEGASIEAAREELVLLGDRYFADNGIDQPYQIRVDPYAGLPASDRAMVAMFFGMLLLVSAMVMAIACVNVANMLLSRGLERRRELAIRMSLGAGRGRVVRQLLTESALLFVIAAVAGVVVTSWVTDLVVRFYLPQLESGTRLALDVTPDLRVLGFALLMAGTTALVFGLAPALSATRAAGRVVHSSAADWRAPRLRGVLVAGQMALSMVLLVSAGLMTRTLVALDAADLGFDVDGVYLVKFDVEHVDYDADQTRAFYVELLDEVRGIPGVAGAATSRKLPLGSASRLGGIFPEGVEPPQESGFNSNFNRVSTDYFRTAGIPLVAGREFLPSDTVNTPWVAIINETMARRFWGDEAAPGKRFDLQQGDDLRTYEVIGIAADANYHSFVEETPRFMYLAATQSPDSVGHVLVRGDLEGTLGAVRQRVAGIDADVPIADVSTLREAVNGFAMGQRLAAWVSGVVGLVGLLLGAVGVYGVTSFAVGQRKHEIGVRIALGARAADVYRLMLRRGIRAPIVGMAAGLVLSVFATRTIASFLYGVSSTDPSTYLVVAMILGSVAVLATLLPSRRAATLDPVQTLRSE